MNTVIETEGLGRAYGRTEAVRAATLSVPRGAVVALLGPNGAGKTTLLKLLAGLQRPTSGRARVLGREPARFRPEDRRRIAYLSEDQRLPLWMTVGGFLDFCRELYPRWDDALAARLTGIFGLDRKRRLSELSRGTRAKAVLTSCLAYRPELLLLDEPLSGIDVVTREEIMAGVLELVAGEGGLSTLLSSHEIDDVERLADWVLILIGGEVRAAEPLTTLQARFRRVEVVGAGDPLTAQLPAGCWLERPPVKEEEDGPPRGQSLSLTHASWDPGRSEAGLRALFPGATISAEPMGLRQIYRAHAHRFVRAGREGGAR